MELNIKTDKNTEEIVDFIAMSINKKLEEGRNVLLFVTGGSTIPVEALVLQKIKAEVSHNLVITLTDERYGQVGHSDSNWEQLKQAGFNVHQAKLIPFLAGKDLEATTSGINNILEDEINKDSYKIGLFGIGVDNHTAGILPYSEAVHSEDLVCFYKTQEFDRITITPKTILMLDEAIVYAMGERKWPAIKNLKSDLALEEAPSQILKSIPLLTIFTDYKK